MRRSKGISAEDQRRLWRDYKRRYRTAAGRARAHPVGCPCFDCSFGAVETWKPLVHRIGGRQP